MISRDSFYASEIDIFKAISKWTEHNKDSSAASEIVRAIRLPLMNMHELLNVVRPSSMMNADLILDAIKVKSESRDMDLNYRGSLGL